MENGSDHDRGAKFTSLSACSAENLRLVLGEVVFSQRIDCDAKSRLAHQKLLSSMDALAVFTVLRREAKPIHEGKLIHPSSPPPAPKEHLTMRALAGKLGPPQDRALEVKVSRICRAAHAYNLVSITKVNLTKSEVRLRPLFDTFISTLDKMNLEMYYRFFPLEQGRATGTD